MTTQARPPSADSPSPPEPGTPLVPPRPNLGPEPWRDRPGLAVSIIAVAVVALLGALALLIALRRRRRRSRAPRPASQAGALLEMAAQSPEHRLVSQAEAIREALIVAFGPSWAARTTEEVAAAPELADRIGPDRAARVVSLLAEADRAKFAGEGPGDAPGIEDAERWVPEAVEALTAGATSKKSDR